MTELLRLLLSLSLSGTVLAGAAALCVRLLRGRASQAFGYYIWLVVLLRLLVPVTLPGSLMQTTFDGLAAGAAAVQAAPSADGTDGGTAADDTPQAAAPDTAAPDAASQTATEAAGPLAPAAPGAESTAPDAAQSAPGDTAASAPVVPGNTPQDAEKIEFPREITACLPGFLVAVWLVGAVGVLLRNLTAYLRFTTRLRRSRVSAAPAEQALFDRDYPRSRVQLYRSTAAPTPMLVGLVRPAVYLPAAWQPSPDALALVLRHEMTHCRRRDLWYKWLTLLAAAVHWFNPVVWWVARRVEKACELACDEAVVRGLSGPQRTLYGRTLLEMAAHGPLPGSLVTTTLSEDGKELKARLTGLFADPRRTAGVAALSAAAVALLVGCGLALGAAGGPLAEEADPAAAASSASAAASAAALDPALWTTQPEQGTPFTLTEFARSDGGLLYTAPAQFPDAVALQAALADWADRQAAAGNPYQPDPLPAPALLWALPADYDGDGAAETFFAVGVSDLASGSLWDSVSVYLLAGGRTHWVLDGNATLAVRLVQYQRSAQLLLDCGSGLASGHSSALLGWDGSAVTTLASVSGASLAQADGVLYADAAYAAPAQPIPLAACWDEAAGQYRSVPWQQMPLKTAQQWMPWTGWRGDPPGAMESAAQLNQRWVLALYAPADGQTERTVRIGMKEADGVWRAYAEWQTSAGPDELLSFVLQQSWDSLGWLEDTARPLPTAQPGPTAQPADAVGEWVDEPGGPYYTDGAAAVEYTLGAAGSPDLPPQLTARPATLPLKVAVWVSARPGGHSLQTLADKVGLSLEEFRRCNPDLTDEAVAYAYQNGGSPQLVVDDALALPWDTPTRTVTITMPVEGDAAAWEQRGAWLTRSCQLPADLPEQAALVLAEGYWYLNNRLRGPGQPLGENPLVYAAADGSRFLTWQAFQRYQSSVFTTALAQTLGGSGWCAQNGRLCVQSGDKGSDLSYLATLFTPPVTLADGSIEFYQIALHGDESAIDWGAGRVQPTYATRSRVLLQKTGDGYRVAELELMY